MKKSAEVRISGENSVEGRTPDEIVATDYVYDSVWHSHTALSWLDFAKRNRNVSALQYCGFQLRYGVELLWYELLSVAHPCITREDYVLAATQATTLYRLIDRYSPYYARFVQFWRILLLLDSRPQRQVALWDIPRLKRIHGKCSQKLLHLQGTAQESFANDQWFVDRLTFLDQSCTFIWETMRREGNKVIYHPDGFKKPEVYELWELFRDDKISRDSLTMRLKLAQPVLRRRQ